MGSGTCEIKGAWAGERLVEKAGWGEGAAAETEPTAPPEGALALPAAPLTPA